MDTRSFFLHCTFILRYSLFVLASFHASLNISADFALSQVMAWFQSNSGILSEPFKSNYVWIALVFGPMVSLMFSFATIQLYEHMELWSIRFVTFGIGYLIFIPLTWYYLEEPVFTLKNIISFALCVILISLQFLLK